VINVEYPTIIVNSLFPARLRLTDNNNNNNNNIDSNDLQHSWVVHQVYNEKSTLSQSDTETQD